MKYEEIISFESLYKAHLRARRCKQNKKEVIAFQNNLASNLWKLHYEIKYKRYNIKEYKKFYVYEPKKREIQAISYAVRVVEHALCDNFLIIGTKKVHCATHRSPFYVLGRSPL